MASLLLKPFSKISKAVPSYLQKAIHLLFENCGEGVMLVGGTALAGYYAAHRHSYDIDLFTHSSQVFERTKRATDVLIKKGAKFKNNFKTPLYFHADVSFENHPFTLDIVTDENLFKVGEGVLTQDKVYVASFQTLLAMKIACLVSRSSEKDLYDLDWLFKHTKPLLISDLICLGGQMDAGLNPESLLISLKGALLREEACGFILNNTPKNRKQVFKQINNLRNQLVQKIFDYQKTSRLSLDLEPLKKIVRKK